MTLSLRQLHDLLRPGLWELRGHMLERDFRQPVADLDMWIEETPPRLTICALWKDGSKHYAYMTEDDFKPASSEGALLFKQKVWSLTPESYFDDEIVVAYDEPVNW